MGQHGATPLPTELGLAGYKAAVQGPEAAVVLPRRKGQKERLQSAEVDLVYQSGTLILLLSFGLNLTWTWSES